MTPLVLTPFVHFRAWVTATQAGLRFKDDRATPMAGALHDDRLQDRADSHRDQGDDNLGRATVPGGCPVLVGRQARFLDCYIQEFPRRLQTQEKTPRKLFSWSLFLGLESLLGNLGITWTEEGGMSLGSGTKSETTHTGDFPGRFPDA